MNWTDLLKAEMENAYQASEGLIGMVDEAKLDWKPAGDNNWMTTGQLVRHVTNACGFCVQMFVDPSAMPEHDGPEMPTAEKMPTVSSIDEAKKLLAEDKALAYGMIEQAGEGRLANEGTPAPWDPTPMPLGRRLLSMVEHLNMHKGQLFMYLKMQGKPVNTMHLYGMG